MPSEDRLPPAELIDLLTFDETDFLSLLTTEFPLPAEESVLPEWILLESIEERCWLFAIELAVEAAAEPVVEAELEIFALTLSFFSVHVRMEITSL